MNRNTRTRRPRSAEDDGVLDRRARHDEPRRGSVRRVVLRKFVPRLGLPARGSPLRRTELSIQMNALRWRGDGREARQGRSHRERLGAVVRVGAHPHEREPSIHPGPDPAHAALALSPA